LFDFFCPCNALRVLWIMKNDESSSRYTIVVILLLSKCAENKRDKEQKLVLTLISIGPLSDG